MEFDTQAYTKPPSEIKFKNKETQNKFQNRINIQNK